MPGLSSTVKLFKKKKKEEKRNLFPLSSLIKRTSLRESFSFLSSLPKLKLFPPSEWNRGILGDNKYSSHSEKILWIGGENLLSSSIKKYIYTRYIPAVCQFEKWHRPWLSFQGKEWKEKENKKMGRGGGKGEESVDNNGFDAKGESRDERISRRPDYTRETELFCIEPFSPLPTLYAPWYHPAPFPPPRFTPVGLFRSHRHPSNRFELRFTSQSFSHDFRMIDRCVLLRDIPSPWKLIVAFHCVVFYWKREEIQRKSKWQCTAWWFFFLFVGKIRDIVRWLSA